MILVFGGTTEGRIAVKKLEESGNPYYYSTRSDEQEIMLQHGVRLCQAMNGEQMKAFCLDHSIKLLIDAGHPFATQLHQTVADVATELQIPAIRFERIFPPRDPSIIWCNGYEDAIQQILSRGVNHLLALTGVQTISKLKPLILEGVNCYFRILRRKSSFKIAQEQGFDVIDDLPSTINHYNATESQFTKENVQWAFVSQKTIQKQPVLNGNEKWSMLTKESGTSGGFQEKVDAAMAQGVTVFAICRPKTPGVFHVVNGEHGLRRMVEKLLPAFYPLHSGITTGTCATAASIASFIKMSKGEEPSEVPVVLPNGETIHVPVCYGTDYAYVLKDSGDDPDVTKGIEIRASISLLPAETPLTAEDQADEDGFLPSILIRGGQGIGRITLPGFDYPVGSAAINKVPRQMIRQNLRLFLNRPFGGTAGTENQAYLGYAKMRQNRSEAQRSMVNVVLSIPEGEAIARRTFNPRLGIVGGISIVGISGIIMPFSIEGFINSIRKCMGVAKAMGCSHVILHSGAMSENFLRENHPDLPPQAFVEYGNYVGEAIRIADQLEITNVTVGIMLGKAVKLAEGRLDTHSRVATMNKVFIRKMMQEAHCSDESLSHVDGLNMARDLYSLLPSHEMEAFMQVVKEHCYEHCASLLPHGSLNIEMINN